MPRVTRTASGTALTDLILDLFRLSSRILTAGDRLVADLGLTSARWQVLGTIARMDRAQPVAWLARDIGGNRQNVQRIVNDLETDGLVAFQPNPHHRRAQLVALTDKGQRTLDAAMQLQAPWANSLSRGLRAQDIRTTHEIVLALRRKLEADEDGARNNMAPVRASRSAARRR
jgi:DNA-binding MarR family transcriptional regulator